MNYLPHFLVLRRMLILGATALLAACVARAEVKLPALFSDHMVVQAETVYGRKVATSGPLPAGQEIRGREIVLRFRQADGGLVARSGELQGFVVADASRAWKPAQAKIAGDTVIVSAAEIAQPVAVRYAWAADPICNLYNGAGLPASPFRTDDWPLEPDTSTP